MAERVTFVEHPAHVDPARDADRTIALGPAAEEALERAGVGYTTPEDYLDEIVLEEKGVANFGKVEVLCAALDAILSNAAPEVMKDGAKPARWHYFWLKLLYDAFFLRAYQVCRVLDAESPREVLYFGRDGHNDTAALICRDESLYAAVLDFVLPTRSIPRVRLETVRESRCAESHADRSPLSIARLWRGAVSRSRRSLADLAQGTKSWSGHRRVLCLDSLYSMPYIADELLHLGFDVWMWTDGARPSRVGSSASAIRYKPIRLADCQIETIMAAVERDASIRGLFHWEDEDFWPVVAPRLRRVVERTVPDTLSVYATATRTLMDLRPDIVLMSSASFAHEKAICHAARREGIPTIVSRHGEMGTHHVPIVEYQDIDSVDWALCWGKWEADWTTRRAVRAVSTRVTGAPMIEHAARRAPARSVLRRRWDIAEHEPVVLYAPTCFDYNWRYFSYRNPSDSTYFRQQKEIVKFLSEAYPWRVVVKIHPAADTPDGVATPLTAWIDRVLGGRVTCISEPGFSDLIHLPEVIVLDSPATTLVQAIQGRAQIYIYNSWFRWEPGVLEALRRTCVVSNDFQAWKDQLRQDLNAGRAFEPRRPDPDLVNCLADPMDRVGGAARACATAVAEIAESCSIHTAARFAIASSVDHASHLAGAERRRRRHLS